MLIAGFTGIGKKLICRSTPNWVSLDYGSFDGDIEAYIRTALSLADDKTNVIVDGIPEIRRYLLDNSIPYFFVAPEASLKEEYQERIKELKLSVIPENLFDDWDSLLRALPDELVIRLHSEEYIFDISWNTLIPELGKEDLKEDVAGMSASLASYAPENTLGTVVIGTHEADLKEPPKKLNEFLTLKIDDICFD